MGGRVTFSDFLAYFMCEVYDIEIKEVLVAGVEKMINDLIYSNVKMNNTNTTL